MRYVMTSCLMLAALMHPAWAEEAVTEQDDTLPPLEITNAWARATTGPTGAVYLTARNMNQQEETVIAGVSTPIAKAAELHTTIKDQRFMRMVKMQDIAIPPAGAVVMQPGGTHIMLVGLEGPLEEGKGFPLTIEIGEEDELTIPVVVMVKGIE